MSYEKVGIQFLIKLYKELLESKYNIESSIQGWNENHYEYDIDILDTRTKRIFRLNADITEKCIFIFDDLEKDDFNKEIFWSNPECLEEIKDFLDLFANIKRELLKAQNITRD